MTLIKTSVLSFVATAIKLLSMLVINKAIAVFVGPSGLALIGQFQNFTQLGITAAQGGINAGLTKYTAEYGRDSHKLPDLFSAAAKISLCCSVIFGAGSIFFSEIASLYFLSTSDYAYIFIIFGISAPFLVLNQLLLSIVNGLKEIKLFISINIIQSVYSLVFTTLLIVFFGLHGALIAMVTNQSVILLIVLWMLRKHTVIRLQAFASRFFGVEGKKLLKYSVMALTSAATVPVSHLLVRNYIGSNLGWEQAGYWQAVWYISTMYLMVVTTALSIYYLPRLSEITDHLDLRAELLSGYKIIMPLVIAMAGIIFILKDLIIWLLFTEEFKQMRELFAWQLVGDVIKLASWLLAYLMLAKAMTRTFIITEILFSVMFVALTVFFVSLFGLIGVTYAFALNYSIYLFIMVFLMRKYIRARA